MFLRYYAIATTLLEKGLKTTILSFVIYIILSLYTG